MMAQGASKSVAENVEKAVAGMALKAEPPARRSPGRAGGSKPEDGRDLRAMIIAATERLLEQRRLEEITVLDVIEEARVSRASFYIYFESKYAPVAALAEELADQIYDLHWAPFFGGSESPTLANYTDHWRKTVAVWGEHKAVLVAAAAAWRADPAAIEGWHALWTRYVTLNREFIARARASGMAPPGPDADALAAALTWMGENALYLAFTGSSPELTDDDRLAEIHALIWHRAIFGS
jgi:AcrR family transcriptional regulator